MRSAHLATLKFLALLFLLPGLAGLIVSAMVSTHYLYTLPKFPVPEQDRVVPRGIHGITVYQTPKEDRELNLMEFGSVGIFVIGLGLSVVYLEKWGSAQVRAIEDDQEPLGHVN
jgi:hypothetical protein